MPTVRCLPAGRRRTDDLLDDKALAGDPLAALMNMLDPERTPSAGWSQPRLANYMGWGISRTRRATRVLQELRYLHFERRSDGNGDWTQWWFLTDEPGAFGDIAGRIAADMAAKRARQGRSTLTMTSVQTENNHVSSGAVDQQPTSDAQPLTAQGEGNTFPQPPAVDGSAAPVRSRSRYVQRARRDRRDALERKGLRPPVLVHPELLEFGTRAHKLTHDLGFPPWMRPEVAGYLAVCLRAGEDELVLMRALSERMEGARDPWYVARKRALVRATRHDRALAGVVGADADRRRAVRDSRRAAAAVAG